MTTTTKIFSILFTILFASIHPYCVADNPCGLKTERKCKKAVDDALNAYEEHKEKEALRILKNITVDNKECVEAHYLLAFIAIKSIPSQLQLAEKHFKAVIEICPEYNIYAYFYLGQIAYSNEKWTDAISYMTDFTSDVDKIKRDKDYDDAADILKWSKFLDEMYSHPVDFKPEVVKNISTTQDEYLASFSPDNQLALFTRKIYLTDAEINNGALRETGGLEYKELFCYSQLTANNIYEEGFPMPKPFNVHLNEGGASMTVDNNCIYYTVCRKDIASYINCDIFMSEKEDGKWGTIHSVSKKINSDKTWESQPSISIDEKTLYFASDRQGGYGGLDIWYSIKNEKNEWNNPINAGPNINTPGNEKCPFIHPDGKTLYFSSDGWMGLGGFDIFYSKLHNEHFSKPVNIGYPINSNQNEAGFFVSLDGKYGYFSSNTLNNNESWNLYKFNMPEKSQPEQVTLIHGNIEDENGSKINANDVKLQLKNISTQKTTDIKPNYDGQYVFIVNANNDYLLTAKSNNYVYNTKLLTNLKESPELNIDNINMEHLKVGKEYTLGNILFETNSYQLSDEGKLIIGELIAFMQEHPSISIEIQGHTDDLGDNDLNNPLSVNRAKAVYNYAIEKKITSSRLTYKGFGKNKPLMPNTSDENRKLNRRTVFVITSN